ncbi:MAG TPA: TonB-dependent receptor, partial [Acidisarcina sp.]
TVSLIRGKQTLRIGLDVAQQIEKDLIPFNTFGSLNFNKGGGFSALGNFLDDYLGPSGTATISAGSPRVDPHAFRQAYFVQDDVKLNPDLTINLGLRYEYQANPENALKYPALDPNNPFAPIDTVFKVKEATKNFGPRIGIAYAPHGGASILNDGKTVYHAGYGLFYDILFTNIVQNSAETAPNVFAGTLTSTQGRGLAGAFSQIANIQPVLSPHSTDETVTNNLINPQTHQWNLGIERQLPWNVKMTVNYVGTRGEHLFANQQYNYFDYNTGSRLNPGRGSIIARGNFADSIYHSLQTEVSHDFSHGVLIRGAWTYGKLLSDGDEVFATFNSPTSFSADLAPGGRKYDWGNSAFDHRHFLAITYVWAVPGLHSSSRFADAFLSGATRHFTISGISQFQSGPYSTVQINGIDINGDGNGGNDRPLLINKNAPNDSVGIDDFIVDPNQNNIGAFYVDLKVNNADGSLNPVDPTKVHWLIPYGPQYVHQGIGRNSFENPGLQFWNVSVQKDLPVHLPRLENSAFQLRAEALDIGNHNNVGPLDTNLLDVGSGTYFDKSSARESDGRQVRFWAKFVF